MNKYTNCVIILDMEIKLVNINKTYYEKKREIVVFKNASFVFPKHKITALLGASGSGKSTLLNIIAGLETIESGVIYFDDKEVNKLSPKERNVGYIFQDYALFAPLSVRDNILFPLAKSHFSKKEKNDLLLELSNKLGIAHLLDRKPKDLSGGEAQRVSIARAIIKSPDILLMDEPFAALDEENKKHAKELIKSIYKDRPLTIIYVSHDKEDATLLADNIINLD